MHFTSLCLFATFGIVVVGSPSRVEVVAARAAAASPYATCTGSTGAEGVSTGPIYLGCCSDAAVVAGDVPTTTGVNCKSTREIRLRR